LTFVGDTAPAPVHHHWVGAEPPVHVLVSVTNPAAVRLEKLAVSVQPLGAPGGTLETTQVSVIAPGVPPTKKLSQLELLTVTDAP
jgi:hypothetical protein